MILLLVAVVVLEDTSKAYRPVDFTIETKQSRDDITSCVATKFKVTPAVEGDKVTLPFYVGTNMLTRGMNSFSMIVQDEGGSRSITAHYRHPLSTRSAIATIRNVAKKCYRAEFNAALSKNPALRVKPI